MNTHKLAFYFIIMPSIMILPTLNIAAQETLRVHFDANAFLMPQLSVSEIIADTGASDVVALDSELNIQAAIYGEDLGGGVTLEQRKRYDDKRKNPRVRHGEVQLGYVLLNRFGNAVAFLGTMGIRQHSTSETEGGLFTQGRHTQTQEEAQYTVGAKAHFLFTIINGELIARALPVTKRWELQATIEADLNLILERYDIEVRFVDTISMHFISNNRYGNGDPNLNYFSIQLRAHKNILPLNQDESSGLYLSYGIGVDRGTNKKTNTYVFIGLGVRLK